MRTASFLLALITLCCFMILTVQAATSSHSSSIEPSSLDSEEEEVNLRYLKRRNQKSKKNCNKKKH